VHLTSDKFKFYLYKLNVKNKNTNFYSRFYIIFIYNKKQTKFDIRINIYFRSFFVPTFFIISDILCNHVQLKIYAYRPSLLFFNFKSTNNRWGMELFEFSYDRKQDVHTKREPTILEVE
jgi:hypothetical protein